MLGIKSIRVAEVQSVAISGLRRKLVFNNVLTTNFQSSVEGTVTVFWPQTLTQDFFYEESGELYVFDEH